MLYKTREEIMADFKAKRAKGEILLGVGAGTGITAKSSEAGGADIFVIYNSGRFRMGWPRLPCRPAFLRRRKPDRCGNGRRGSSRG